jgi:LPXTG-site transpeptidase (sortase) family protein
VAAQINSQSGWKRKRLGTEPQACFQSLALDGTHVAHRTFGLAGFYGAAQIEGFSASRAALENFAAQEVSAVRNPSHEKDRQWDYESGSSEQMDFPVADFRLWGERRIQAYEPGGGKQSGVPLAVLRIPKIHLEAPLFEGTDHITLNHAVGRIAGTARPGEPGNIGIAGHRDGFFRGLKDVGVGDTIELQTLKGSDSYIVGQIQIVNPGQVEVLRPRSVPSLTLVTCYPFYFVGSAPRRYIVTASLKGDQGRG